MSKETEDTLRKMLQEQTRKVEAQAEQLDILTSAIAAQDVTRRAVETIFAEIDQEARADFALALTIAWGLRPDRKTERNGEDGAGK